MVEWQLIGRCTARYTVAYAGATALAATATGIAWLLLGLVAVGLLLLLFAAGGSGSVRMGATMANSQALGFDSGVVDPAEDGLFATEMAADLKLLFYAVGLIAFGFAGMVAVG